MLLIALNSSMQNFTYIVLNSLPCQIYTKIFSLKNNFRIFDIAMWLVYCRFNFLVVVLSVSLYIPIKIKQTIYP